MPKIKKGKFVYLVKDDFWDWTIENKYGEEVGVVDIESKPKRVTYSMHSNTFYDAKCLKDIADILDGIAEEKKIKSTPLTDKDKSKILKSGDFKMYKEWKKWCFYPKTEPYWMSYDSQALHLLADKLDALAKNRIKPKRG